MGNENLDRDFLKQLEPRCFPVFEEILYSFGACLQTLNQAVENSCLAFIFCSHKASKSTRIESLWTCQVFLEHAHSLGHVQGHIHLCGPLDFQQCVGTSQCPYGHLIPELFILGFLVNLPPPQLLHTTESNNCLSLFLTNALRTSLSPLTELKIDQIETALQTEVSPESPDMSNNEFF